MHMSPEWKVVCSLEFNLLNFQITFVFLGSAGGCLLGIFVLAALIKKADWKVSIATVKQYNFYTKCVGRQQPHARILTRAYKLFHMPTTTARLGR